MKNGLVAVVIGVLAAGCGVSGNQEQRITSDRIAVSDPQKAFGFHHNRYAKIEYTNPAGETVTQIMPDICYPSASLICVGNYCSLSNTPREVWDRADEIVVSLCDNNLMCREICEEMKYNEREPSFVFMEGGF